MNLSAFKKHVASQSYMTFEIHTGEKIPAHYHITEIGLALKKYIDCGGTMRYEERISLQLWVADDINHRLPSEKLLQIIEQFEKNITANDAEIEVEYQGVTIGKYGLSRSEGTFILRPTMTDCLAKDRCGISEKTEQNNCCGGGCC